MSCEEKYQGRANTYTKTCSNTTHDDRNELIQISVYGSVKLQGPEANVVKSFVIDTESLVRVLDKLMNGEGGIVRLNDGVRNLREKGSEHRGHLFLEFIRTYLRRRNNRESSHHSVGEFLSDLGDQKCTHTRSSSSLEMEQGYQHIDSANLLGQSSFQTYSQGVSELETLEAITTLDLLPDDIENRVYKLGSFSVMSLRPIVSSFVDDIRSASAVE